MDIQKFAEILDKNSPQTIRFLAERDPFRFLVSVVLSAQTTDNAVNAVVPVLFEAFPTRKALKEAPLEEVETIIHPLGFYHSKAKHLIALASALDGREIPLEIEELVKLPGVGRKTANCYRGDILGKPAIIVDTHFARVMRKFGVTESTDPEMIERTVEQTLPEAMWYRFSMTANLLGRTTCHAKHPECFKCPVASLCPSKVDVPSPATT